MRTLTEVDYEPLTKKYVMYELNKTGHGEITWRQDRPDTVEAARLAFNAAKAGGFHMFASNEGQPGRRIIDFDPSVERIVMVKQIVAG